MKRDYLLLDVFTKTPLSGNPLAVFLNGDGLLDNQMQAIARELNLSEMRRKLVSRARNAGHEWKAQDVLQGAYQDDKTSATRIRK